MRHMRQNFIVQFTQLVKHWLCDVQSGVVRKNWALSVDHCWLQALQVSLYLIDFLSILPRCNGFTGIQKTVVDQAGSRPLNSSCDLFFGACLAFGSALELLLSLVTELAITGCYIFLSHITI